MLDNRLKSGVKDDKHFLYDRKLIDTIVGRADLSKWDTVLEIGGGEGTLSSVMLERCKELIIIEKDAGLAAFLSDKFNDCKNVSVLHGDALKVGLPRFNKIVASMPYSIVQQFFLRLVDEKRQDFEQAVLVVPYAFGRKITAGLESDYFGVMSALFMAFYEVEIFLEIDKQHFSPPPMVTSVAVSMKPFDMLHVQFKTTRLILQRLFGHRHKKVKNVIIDCLWDDGEAIFSRKFTKREAKALAEDIVKGVEQIANEKEALNLTNDECKAITLNLVAWEKRYESAAQQ